MNRLVQSSLAADPNKQQPLPVASVLFMQDAAKEAIGNAAINIIGANYSTSQAYILFGCVRSGAADGGSGAGAITAGAIFYNGEVYTVPAATYTLAVNYAVGTITVTNPSPDPILLKDGTSTNVHNVRQIVFTAGASGSGTFDYASTVNLAKVNLNYYGAGSVGIANNTYTNITGATLTTPNDGFTRTYMVIGRADVTVSNGAATSDISIQAYNSTTTTAYNSTTVGKANGTSTDVYVIGCSIIDVRTIAPNNTIVLQGKYTGAAGSVSNVSLMLVELR